MKFLCAGSLSLTLLSGCASIDISGMVNKACNTEPKPAPDQYFSAVQQIRSSSAGTSETRSRAAKPEKYVNEDRIKAGAAALAKLTVRATNLQETRRTAALAQALGYDPVTRISPLTVKHAIAGGAAMESASEALMKAQPALTDESPTAVATVSPKTMEHYQAIAHAGLSGGFEALAAASYQRLKEVGPSDAEAAGLEQQFVRAGTMALYLRAYFRGGQVIQVKLDTADILDKLKKQVSTDASGKVKEIAGLSEDQKKKISEAIGSALDDMDSKVQGLCRGGTSGNDCFLTRPLGKEVFVTRSGMKVGFSGWSVEIGSGGKAQVNSTHPSSTEVGPQLARVITEALFDGSPDAVVVPAVADSTACTAFPDDCVTDKNKAKIAILDDYGNEVEGWVTSLAGQGLRLLGPTALNNEAIAKSLETTAGVVARKTLEQVAWPRLDSCEQGRIGPPVLFETR